MKKITMLVMLFATLFTSKTQAFVLQDDDPQTVTATYSDGDISVAGTDGYDPDCAEILSVELPAGNDWLVTSVDIEYEMTAQGGAWMSEQRSQMHLVNTSSTEDEVYSGTGNAGTFSYDRTETTFANGIYAAGTELEFELRAWRTWPGGNTDCSTQYHQINNNTWTITVTYEEAPDCQFVTGYFVDDITDTTADISWNPSPTEDGGYEYVLMNAGEAPDTDTAVQTGTTASGVASVDLVGLDAQADYSFYTKTICEDGEESDWSPVLNFSTECGAIGDFETDFSDEETGSIPECWVGITNSTGASPNLEVTTFSAPTFGDKQVRFQSSGDTETEHFLVSPELNNLAGNAKRVRFSGRQTLSHANVIEVGTMSDPEDENTFTSISTINLEGNEVENFFAIISETNRHNKV